jgi:4'-phosphopantetheinyl transferase
MTSFSGADPHQGRLAIGPDEAHVWYVRHDAIDSAALLDAYYALMTEDERARHARFYFDDGKKEYLVTRALVRTVLSRYADVAPGDWHFVANEHGRPEILAPRREPRLRFNLSNTRGLIACLVVLDRDAGLDVENGSREGQTVAIADRFFAKSEFASLRALPEESQRDRFFVYWTLKEAYIKARGMGLAIPLDQFAFDVERAPIGIAFGPKIEDDPDAWQFARLFPGAPHYAAVAIHRGAGKADLTIVEREIVPLRG